MQMRRRSHRKPLSTSGQLSFESLESRNLLAADSWMGDLPPGLTEQTINKLIIPGTHDSGTYALHAWPANPGSPGSDQFAQIYTGCFNYVAKNLSDVLQSLPAIPNDVAKAIAIDFAQSVCGIARETAGPFFIPWAATQSKSIHGQLDAGARSFDLRFFRATTVDASGTGSPLTAGEFYIHHALAGPNSDTIFGDIKSFLEEPGHEKEIIVLNFSNMTEGASSSMSDAAKTAFLNDINTFLGPYLLPSSLGETATLGDIWNTDQQVILRFPDGWDDKGVLDDFVWEDQNDNNDGFWDGEYPHVDDWTPLADLHSVMDDFERTHVDQLAHLGLNLGVDDGGDMIMRGYAMPTICPLVVDFGVHTLAVRDYLPDICDFGTPFFTNLKHLALNTNPQTVARLPALPRENLNIVSVDFIEFGGLVSNAIDMNTRNVPMADAGGPYAVPEGGSIALDASASVDFDQATNTLTFSWDFDGDGQFDDATGMMPTFDAGPLDNGDVEVKVKVTDDDGLFDIAKQTVTVTNVAPTIDSLNADALVDTGAPISVTGSFSDPARHVASEIFTGTAVWSDGQNSSVTVDPNGTFSTTRAIATPGVFTVTVTISDDDGGSDTATSSNITVNTPPVAEDDWAESAEDVAVTIGVLANDADADGDPLTVNATTAPGHGVVTINADNTLTYVPHVDFHGTDLFGYSISDGRGGVAHAEVTIKVLSQSEQIAAMITCIEDPGTGLRRGKRISLVRQLESMDAKVERLPRVVRLQLRSIAWQIEGLMRKDRLNEGPGQKLLTAIQDLRSSLR